MNNLVLQFEYSVGKLSSEQKKFLDDLTPLIKSINIEQLKLMNIYHKFVHEIRDTGTTNNNYLLKNPQLTSESRNTFAKESLINKNIDRIHNNNLSTYQEHQDVRNGLLEHVESDPRYLSYNTQNDDMPNYKNEYISPTSSNTNTNKSIPEFEKNYRISKWNIDKLE